MAAEEFAELLEGFSRGIFSAGAESVGERAFVTSGEADQAGVCVLQFVWCDGAFAFCGAEFHLCDETAEIFVAFGGSDEERKAPAERAGDFGTDQRANADFLSGQIELWSAVESIAIEQRHGRHAEIGAGRCEVGGRRGTFEKAESGAGVEFDIGQ